MFLTASFLLLVFVSTTFSASNYFIDSIQISLFTQNIAYPVNKCVPNYIGSTPPTYPFAIYDCSNDGSTVTVNKYLQNDQECAGAVSVGDTYSMTNIIPGEHYSFECNGLDNYVSTNYYLSNICHSVYYMTTSHIATDVCFNLENNSTFYREYDCSSNETAYTTYNGSNCSVLASPMTYDSSCSEMPEMIVIYHTVKNCTSEPTTEPTVNPTMNPSAATAIPTETPTMPTTAPTADLSDANYFIDIFSTYSSVSNFTSDFIAYPVNICVPQELQVFSDAAYAIYRCNTAGDEVTVEQYADGDSDCSGSMISTTAHNNTNTTFDSEEFSFECNGENNYLAFDTYSNNHPCTGDILATSYIAVGVCYELMNGGYSKFYCDEDIVYESSYVNDSTCTSAATNIVSEYPNLCKRLLTDDSFTIYSKITICMINDVDVLLRTYSPTVNPTNTESGNSGSLRKDLSAYAIFGVIVGSIVLLIFFSGLAFYCCQKKKAYKQELYSITASKNSEMELGGTPVEIKMSSIVFPASHGEVSFMKI